MASQPLVQGPLFGAPVSRLDFTRREFVKTPSPSPESSPEKEDATPVEVDLAALDIHDEPRKVVVETAAGDKAKYVAASCSNDVPSAVCEMAKAPAPASDWKAAAMAACDESWAAAAKSMYKEVREAAARHYAEEAAAAGKVRATRKKRLSQKSIDVLLARAKEPRPVLRVNHELLDSLKTLSPEMREDMRAARTMAVVNLQALQDWEQDLVRRYHTYGYIEIEVDEEDEDIEDDKLWDSWL